LRTFDDSDYIYCVSGHFPSSRFLFKTRRFGDWIQSPSVGGAFSVEPFDTASPYLWTPVEVEVEVNLRPIVSRPVCPGVRRPSGARDQCFFLLEISFRQLRVCYFVAPSLTRGRVCNLLYNCFWALPEQSLLGRSPAELTTIFYCLI
jgi:hypothetical protein